MSYQYHFAFTKNDLFNMVELETTNISDQVGAKPGSDLPEKVPLTENDRDQFNIFLNRGGSRLFERIAKYAHEGEDYPYYITDSTATDYPDSVVYKLTFPTDVKKGTAIALITSTLCKALVSFVEAEWFKLKGLHNYAVMKEQEFEKACADIERGINYGHKVTRPYQTL